MENSTNRMSRLAKSDLFYKDCYPEEVMARVDQVTPGSFSAWRTLFQDNLLTLTAIGPSLRIMGSKGGRRLKTVKIPSAGCRMPPGYRCRSILTAGAAGWTSWPRWKEGRHPARGFRPIPTGLQMALPEGFEGQVRPRSGLAARYGVTVLNAPGTIDSDYRGEVQVLLVNHGPVDFVVRRGDRIAQLVVAEVVRGEWQEVTGDLAATARGEGGFGHTGV